MEPKINTVVRCYEVQFKALGDMTVPTNYENVVNIFNAAIARVSQNMQPHDYIRFHMGSQAWKRSMNLPFLKVDELTGRWVLQEFMKTDQSNDSTGLEADGVYFDIIHTVMLQGAGWTKHGSCQNRVYLELGKWLKIKRCTIAEIQNTDNMCLARAVVVAKGHHIANLPGATPGQKTEYGQLWDVRNQLQGVKAAKLCKDAGADFQRPCGIPEGKKFQDLLKPLGYSIIIYTAEANFTLVFLGEETGTKPLQLLHYDNHFVVLVGMAPFFNTAKFCWHCLKGRKAI